jgi:hypothetical protein
VRDGFPWVGILPRATAKAQRRARVIRAGAHEIDEHIVRFVMAHGYPHVV